MRKISKLVLPVIGISFLASCASNVDNVEVLDNTTNEGQVQIVNSAMDSIPEWFMNPEEVEGTIVSTGTATAPDLQLSVDIAVLNAKTVLADRLNGKLSGMIKNYISKVGQANKDVGVIEEIEKTARNVIAEVDVSGYRVAESLVIPAGNQFRTFVRLEYNEEIAEKILSQKLWKHRSKTSKLRANEAFEELDEKIEETMEYDYEQAEPIESAPIGPVTSTDI